MKYNINKQSVQADGSDGEKMSVTLTRYDGTTFSAILSEMSFEKTQRSNRFTCHPIDEKFYGVSLSELLRGIMVVTA